MTIIITDETKSGEIAVSVKNENKRSSVPRVLDLIVEGLAPHYIPFRSYLAKRKKAEIAGVRP